MAESGDAEMKDADPQQNGTEEEKEKENEKEEEKESGKENGTENGTDSANNDDRKLFVGRLSWETTDKELSDHFGQYGEIESVSVKTDPSSGRSRGFAFIVFKDVESIEKVMAAGDHVINNKKVDPKKAKARHGKIFVGGLDVETSEEDIRNFFGQYGTIVEVELPFDKQKNQRKNFCFITFESEQVTNDLLKQPKQTINGKEVDVKKANPKVGEGRNGPGGRGGRGRGGPGRRGQGGWNNQGGYGGNYGGGYGGYGGGYGYDGYYNPGGYGGGYSGYEYSGYGQGYNQGYGGGGGGGYDGYGYGSGYDGYGGGGGGVGGGGGGGRGGRGKGGFGGGKQRGGRSQRPAPY